MSDLMAAAGLAVTYKGHHSRWAVFFGLTGVFLMTASKFLPPTMKFVSMGLEGAGFICMVSGNILPFGYGAGKGRLVLPASRSDKWHGGGAALDIYSRKTVRR